MLVKHNFDTSSNLMYKFMSIFEFLVLRKIGRFQIMKNQQQLGIKMPRGFPGASN